MSTATSCTTGFHRVTVRIHLRVITNEQVGNSTWTGVLTTSRRGPPGYLESNRASQSREQQ